MTSNNHDRRGEIHEIRTDDPRLDERRLDKSRLDERRLDGSSLDKARLDKSSSTREKSTKEDSTGERDDEWFITVGVNIEGRGGRRRTTEESF